VPPPLVYAAGFAIGLIFEIAFPLPAPPPPIAVAAGVFGIAVWLALDGAAMLHFRVAGTSVAPMRPTTALVTSGPYRFTRNPMYVGMAFLYLGLGLLLGAIWSVVLLPAVLATVHRVAIVREERYLEARFGDEYRTYKSRVGRWL
jgi:protein-S-isoprenylcysteine O-methyltransferase Ste14